MIMGKGRTKAELKYIGGVFVRTGAVAIAWFGLTGLALNSLGDRVSLQCERNEESLPECQLSTKHLFTETSVNESVGEFQTITNQAMSNEYIPSLTEWEMEIVTSRGKIRFNTYGLAKTNHWQDFTDRTNRFLDTPQLRTFAITSEYSFWFKFLSQAVSGVSILCGLFIIPGLYLAVKYASDYAAQEVALDKLFSQVIRPKPAKAIASAPTEKVRE